MFLALERAVTERRLEDRFEARRERAEWSQTDYLLALLCELVHTQYRAFVMVNSKKGTQAPEPLKIPRPHERRHDRAPKRLSNTSEIKAFLRRNPPGRR